ncbi:tyrosine-type recombinase/integrase [Shewanella sp. FJAT-51649]|uniref:tyrosine-type recombinase/integrase n=1 Tax=Shewanella sp. FJAT-51649 TaxID=2864210 RepID=UPI001C65FE65|nr:tyrosine-type recombinase/integrase [Shewanella sp. FJAT-51649]QYJ73413.1 tyrosine-type recombinase/integrase [Shewanella sp. FJAT-51649]
MSKSIIHYSTGGSTPSRSSGIASNITPSDRQMDPPFFEESSLPQSVHSDFFNAAAETEYEISSNTRRVYRTSFGLFEQYCATHQLQPLPADPRSIISFIGHQKELLQASSGTQLSKQTLTTRLAAIRYYHIQAGLPSPTEHPLVIRVMRGLSRNHHRQVQDYDQQPIMYDEVELLIQAIEQQPHPLLRLRDKAIIQLGLQGGFRRSELANLKVQYLSFMRDKLKVRLPFSKSNQQGLREWKNLPDSEPFAAYNAVKDWLHESNITEGHLFRSISRDGKTLRPYQVSDKVTSKSSLVRNSGFLNGDDIYRIIKQYCLKAGLPAQYYGAHSLRSGCVTQLHENNKDILYIMARTGHTDPRSLRHYLKPKED